jgi:hypothetical protein
MDEERRRLIGTLGDAWEPEPASSPEAIVLAQAALEHHLPIQLLALYQIANGATVYPVDIFSIRELINVNRGIHPALPSAVFCAGDGADGFFFIDDDGRLGEGTGAVFWIDRGFIVPTAARPCAPDLFTFLKDVATGKQAWLDVEGSLGKRQIQAMLAALKLHSDRWLGRPGADPVRIYESGSRVGAAIPESLESLLSMSDGMLIPNANIEIWPVAQIEPVAGLEIQPGMPQALWFAEDRQARRYAITLLGGRTPYSNEVVGAGPQEATAESFLKVPLLGSLPNLVLNWLEIGP